MRKEKQWRNIKKLLCLFLAVGLICGAVPVKSILAVESETAQGTEETAEQASDSEPTATSEHGDEDSESTEAKPAESGETEQLENILPVADTNSISGMVWKDANKNGIYDSGEQPIVGYCVYLYKEGDLSAAVKISETGTDGKYEFIDIELGSYVVGVRGEEVNGVDYLAPIIGVTEDNKFNKADTLTEYIALSEPVEIVGDTVVTDINAGMRTFSTRISPMVRWSGGAGTQVNPYLISNEQDLRDLATAVNGGNSFLGDYFELTTDISLNNVEWTAIGTAAGDSITITNPYPFSGIFDGQNHIISGLSINKSSTNFQGLFGYVDTATIKNLTVDGNVLGMRGTGILVGVSSNSLIIDNCKTSGTAETNSGTGERVGGLIGWVDIFHATGKIVEIKNSSSSANVTTTLTGSYYVGGLIGMTWIHGYQEYSSIASTDNHITISNCYATGDVKTNGSNSYYVGGLAGFLEIYHHSQILNNTTEVINCYATGDVYGASYYNGGLVGHTHNGIAIRNSYATGDVYGAAYSNGGLVGYSYGYGNTAVDGYTTGSCVIENCYATGNVVGRGTWNGGLVGFADTTNIINSYAIGSVTGSGNYNGALIGKIYGTGYRTATIKNCYAAGTVSGTISGGLVADVSGDGTATNINFSDCYFDTTTTTKSVGHGTGTNSTTGNIKGLSTKSMIDFDLAGSPSPTWSIRENQYGKANGAGTTASPWYIDDDVTYPYLYYQYDGFDTTGDGKGDGYLCDTKITRALTNYYIAYLKYSSNSGSTYQLLAQNRADYSFAAAISSLKYEAKTVGAVRAWYPYTYGTTSATYNTFKYPFDAINKLAYIPKSGVTSATANTLYSFGAISATNIVAFSNMPYAEKSNDRSALHTTSTTRHQGHTYVGDIFTYTIDMYNYSTEADWENVVFKDPLPFGVTLKEGTLELASTINNMTTTIMVPEYTGTDPSNEPDSAKPFYTYEKDAATGQYVLTIYLKNMSKATETGGTSGYTVTFDVFVGKDAKSNFVNDAYLTEDNIRNSGTVTGDLLYYNEITGLEEGRADDYEAPFDDEDTDPVYGAYKVVYHGNSWETSDDSETVGDGYYIKEESFTVLTNNETKFVPCEGAVLVVWNTEADGSGDDYTPGDTTAVFPNDDVDGDFHLYAQWKYYNSIKVIKYGDGSTILPDATFKIEVFTGTDADDQDQLKNDSNWQQTYWDSTNSKWVTTDTSYAFTTDSAGALRFTGLEDGVYRITEISSPAGYSLLKDAIIAKVPFSIKSNEADYNTVISNKTPDIFQVDDSTGTAITTAYYYNLTYTVTDAAALDMPQAGNVQMLSHIFVIAGLMIIAVLCGGYGHRRWRGV